MKNVGESVKTRLRNQARELNLAPELLYNRYVFERFIHRLSISGHSDKFALKGGMLVAIWNGGDLSRPTKDIDLNGFDRHEKLDTLAKTIETIATTDVPDDGVTFDTKTILVKHQREGFVPGAHVQLQAYLHTSLIKVRVDVGFGNAITPGTRLMEYPSLLDAPKPVVHTYPPETTIAEKLHAMSRHGRGNTRYKDYYDIWLLQQLVQLDTTTLAEALCATFECQETELPTEEPIAALSDGYVESKEKAWANYVAESGLARTPPSLRDIVTSLRELVDPVFEEARTIWASRQNGLAL